MYRFNRFTVLILLLMVTACKQVEIVRFSGTPYINEGEEATLTWETHNADSVSIEGVAPELPKSGLLAVSPNTSTLYTLRAYRNNDVASATHAVSVRPKPTQLTARPTVQPSRSLKQSKYLSGILPVDSITSNDNLHCEIVGYDNTGYPNSVKLFAVVRDDYGNFIANLAPPYGDDSSAARHFHSLAEKVSNGYDEVRDFTVREIHDSASSPRAISLVLDYSGSMIGSIGDLERSALSFINAKEPEDEISVVKFGLFLSQEVPLEQSADVLRRDFRRTGLMPELGYSTSLYAGADEGLRSLKGTTKSHAMVLFTDGHENSSLYHAINGDYCYTPRELVVKAIESRTPIYTVGFAGADSSMLSTIAMVTGGKSFYAQNGREITDIYASLPRMFRNYYEVTFKPVRQESLRTIELAVQPKDSALLTNTTTYTGGTKDLPEDLESATDPQAVAHFESGKSTITESDKFGVEQIAEFLKAHTSATVLLRGHTDLKGDARKNEALSLDRAKKVAGILVKMGVARARITTLGAGSSEPIWSPDDEDWQAVENRRVDIVVKN